MPRAFDQPPFICSIPDGIMCHDRVYDHLGEVTFDPPIFDHVAHKLYLSKANFTPPVPVEGEVYTCIKAFSGNYAHWLYDILPCFRLFDPTAAKVYIASDKSFQKQFLEIMGVKDIIPYPEIPSLQATVLHFVYSGSRYQIRDFYKPFRQTKGTRRLYVSRRDAKVRRVTNEKELLVALSREGFESLTLSDLTVDEQIQAFSEAEIIVGPHGAGMANLFFCYEGTKVIQFWPGRTFESINIYPSDLTYHNLIEKSGNKDDITVNIGRVMTILKGKML